MIWEQPGKFKEVARDRRSEIVEGAIGGRAVDDVTDARGKKMVRLPPRAALLFYFGIIVVPWALILLFVFAS